MLALQVNRDVLQCKALPFGLNIVPQTLSQLGVEVLLYLDDWLDLDHCLCEQHRVLTLT